MCLPGIVLLQEDDLPFGYVDVRGGYGKDFRPGRGFFHQGERHSGIEEILFEINVTVDSHYGIEDPVHRGHLLLVQTFNDRYRVGKGGVVDEVHFLSGKPQAFTQVLQECHFFGVDPVVRLHEIHRYLEDGALLHLCA